MSEQPKDLQALRAQLEQLQARHAAGSLGDEAYGAARAALEAQIVAAVTGTPAAAAAAVAAPAAAGMSRGLMLGAVALVVGVVAAGAWWQSRNPAPADEAAPAVAGGASGASPHAMGKDQMAAMTDRLAERLKNQPDDADGWAMLGRSYAATGRPAEAIEAYKRVLKLRPDDAAVMADYADALAIQNGRNLEGEPLQWIDRALKADPVNVKALALAGTVAFNRGNFALAAQHWERAIKSGPPDHPIVRQLGEGVAEARRRAAQQPPAAPKK
ncbi:hypothetical protein RA210_U120050 [Rubrivivax sp. A210]|uniref:tetratricopeptide repeat protein n=1 Tax=Rubrivivax sp. A210 TaxID=2772301 RepID=UPI00191AA956|nr:tetratricopeptide repeat protein [Rubrivivax sp. A210]CAD5370189.1 hypothetical protein RA210_U120050 [Rubrivivax sp. A210]